ncbi:MAG: hypothetical protein AAGJ46_17605 [Planctomycetota bacterium]
MKSSDLFKRLPTINELLSTPQIKSAVDRLNSSAVASRVRGYLDELRDELSQRAEDLPLPSVREVIDRVARFVSRDEGWHLSGVVNATGQLRGGPWAAGPMEDAATERVLLLSKDYVGETGGRPGVAQDAVAELCRLTGAESAAVFHTRAGALWLILTELACEPPVVVARGELGEVDPGCRLVDLCNTAGARMHEVGATDSVTVDDYQTAMAEGGVLLRLAAEAYRMVGSMPRPSVADAATAAHERDGLLIEDLAGGPLVSLPTIDGITSESAAEALSAGADLAIVRGDGLIGGPPCGIVLGRADLIDRLHARPLAAALRPSVATVAALATGLKSFDPDAGIFSNPLLSLLSTPLENLRTRCERLAPQIAASPLVSNASCEQRAADQAPLSGLPYSAPGWVLSLEPASGNVDELAQRLAAATPAVWGRVEGDRFVLDLRTVFPRQDLSVVSALSIAGGDPEEERRE